MFQPVHMFNVALFACKALPGNDTKYSFLLRYGHIEIGHEPGIVPIQLHLTITIRAEYFYQGLFGPADVKRTSTRRAGIKQVG